jgi:hypothetical protein
MHLITYFSQCAAPVSCLNLIHAPFFLGGTSLDPNGSNLRIRAIFSVSQFSVVTARILMGMMHVLALSFPAHHTNSHIKTRAWRYLTNLLIRARWFSTKVGMWPITSATKRTIVSPSSLTEEARYV